jgi:hypothetical protein
LDQSIKERGLEDNPAIELQVWEGSTTTSPKRLLLSPKDSEKIGRYGWEVSRPIVFVIANFGVDKVVDAAEELAEAKWEPPTPTPTATPTMTPSAELEEQEPVTDTAEANDAAIQTD